MTGVFICAGAANSPSSSRDAGAGADAGGGTLLFMTLAGALGVRSSPDRRSRISWGIQELMTYLKALVLRSDSEIS